MEDEDAAGIIPSDDAVFPMSCDPQVVTDPSEREGATTGVAGLAGPDASEPMPEVSLTPVLPMGTVTLLLSDIERSTQPWQRDGVSAGAVIARHYEILNDAIAAHEGVRPVEQGEGNSIVAAFVRASDAVAAARTAQLGLMAVFPDLRVRMALHTGEVGLRDAGNYMGDTIIRCARLRNCAHGGQVLLSRATVELVGDRLPAETSIRPLGPHRLKDLARPEHVWQLECSGLRHDFPALRSADSYRTNLPSAQTPLVGRSRETAELVALVGTHRVVSLIGTGGIGKTRLALAVGRELADRFPGGTWWVDLSAVTDPAAVATAMLHGIDAFEIPGHTPEEQLVAHLTDRPTFVLIDNCEHLIDAVATITLRLIGSCPDLRLLTTSREPLAIGSEVAWRVPSLSVPVTEQPGDVGSHLEADSVQLFIERARRARPNLALDDAAITAIARVCRRLDGIALAIELAASRCRSMSPEKIAESLDDRFRLLTGGTRAAIGRQQTLLASVEWSHQLIDDAERAAWRRLSVFTGPFTLDGAEWLIGGFGDLDRYDVIDVLGRLVDKSIIATDDGNWYRLLETMRQFGLQQLQSAGEAAVARDTHCDFHADWCRKIDVHEQSEQFATAAILYPNLMTALDWATTGRQNAIGSLLSVCAWVWTLDGRHQDALNAGRSALDVLRVHDRAAWMRGVYDTNEAMLSADLLGYATGHLGQLADAASSADPELGSLHGQMVGLMGGDVSALVDSLELAVQLGHRYLIAGAAAQLATNLTRRGHLEAAIPHLELAKQDVRSGELASIVITTCELKAAVERLEPRQVLAQRLEQALRQVSDTLDRPHSRAALVSLLSNIQPAAWLVGDGDLTAWATDLLERAIAEAPTSGRQLLLEFNGPDFTNADAPDTLDRYRRLFSFGRFGQHHRVDAGRFILNTADPARALEFLEPLADPAVGYPIVTVVHHLVTAIVDRDVASARAGLSLALELGQRRNLLDLVEAAAWIVSESNEALAAQLTAACDVARATSGFGRIAPYLAALDALANHPAYDTGRELSLEQAAELLTTAARSTRPTFGWKSLTPAEEQVLLLVCEGLTNAQVAARLHVSIPTVKTHLAHIFTKLTVPNRATLIAEALARQ